MDNVPDRSIQPAGPAAAYQTYEIRTPRATHHRPASCDEVGCVHFQKGWTTTVPTGSPDEMLIRRLARGEVDTRKRPFTESVDGGMTVFRFEPGTPCFRAGVHTTNLGRQPLLIVRDGDFRGTSGTIRHHANEADWVEDFALHQQGIADRIGRG